MEYFNITKVHNEFNGCTNLAKLGFSKVVENLYNGSNSSNCMVIANTSSIKSIPTYNFIGKIVGTSRCVYFQRSRTTYMFLPRASGEGGNGQANITDTRGFWDFGALIKNISSPNYGCPTSIVLRCPNVVTGTLATGSYKPTYIYVPSNLLDAYKACTNPNWAAISSRIYAIGGERWQTLFASTSNPASEYADIEYYAPELYDEYVEGYEESKVTANE